MDKPSALKKQIEFELATEIKKGRAKIKDLKDGLSVNYSLSGTFKGVGSGMAQNSVNKSIEDKKKQIESARTSSHASYSPRTGDMRRWNGCGIFSFTSG